jgi:hypothetical protein|tara:strand:+ start:1478 stop:1645 length:168 start_codon:yes stop_codon:yes gene_type:complete
MGELTSAAFVLVPAATALAWLVTLHSRVRAHSEDLIEVKADLRYIRERIDRALNN